MFKMNLPYACILIAAILPYVFVSYAKFSGKGYDNNNPRDFLDKTEGKSKRAHYAHLNSFEAFPPFAIGVIIAYISGASTALISVLTVLFVIFRILYGICYIQNKSTLRSMLWGCAFACTIGLYLIAIK